MELLVSIDGVEKPVRAEKAGDGYRVTVSGRAFDVPRASVHDGVLNFFVGRRTFRAMVSCNRIGIQVTLQGRDYLFQRPMDDGRSEGALVHDGNGSVEAPMPGTITAVHVKSGDTVKAGDALVVLESMKMQNEITSTVNGIVRSLRCAVGDQVDYGALLVEVEAGGAP
jgi:biotin carboxyl carrier protein